jgi:hypothetical protein
MKKRGWKLTLKTDPARGARGHRVVGRAATFADRRTKRQRTRSDQKLYWLEGE